MKKKLLTLMIMMMAAGFATAQITYSSLESDFKDFSDDMAGALPYASTLGLNWSDAYLGGFPHFGVGLTTGFVSLPSDSFEAVATQLGVDLPSFVTGSLGVPLPAYTVDARVGIPILPIDVGVKGGFLSPGMLEDMTGGVGIDYMMLGGDVRWGVMKGGLILPSVSIGVGYNYLTGGIYMDGVTPAQTIDFGGADYNGVTAINLTSGDMYYNWNANIIDVKAQASKSFLILTPSVGVGYSYGFSSAGGGIDATITDQTSTPLTDSQISAIEDALDMDISNSGFSILSEANGGSLRVWGGCSFNIVVLKLDLTAMYNLSSQSLGAALNARIQI